MTKHIGESSNLVFYKTLHVEHFSTNHSRTKGNFNFPGSLPLELVALFCLFLMVEPGRLKPCDGSAKLKNEKGQNDRSEAGM